VSAHCSTSCSIHGKQGAKARDSVECPSVSTSPATVAEAAAAPAARGAAAGSRVVAQPVGRVTSGAAQGRSGDSEAAHMRCGRGQEGGGNGARRAAHRVADAVEDDVVAQQALAVDLGHKQHQHTPLLEVQWAVAAAGALKVTSRTNLSTQEAAVRGVWAARAPVSGKRARQYLPERSPPNAQASGSGERPLWLGQVEQFFVVSGGRNTGGTGSTRSPARSCGGSGQA
jgi:hypothetical protein